MSTRQEGAPSDVIQSRHDLVDWIAKGEKPESDWRIGTEHEKFGYQLENLRPMEYDAHVSKLLHALVDRFDWEPRR